MDPTDPTQPEKKVVPDPEIAAQMGKSAIGDEYLEEEVVDPYGWDEERPLEEEWKGSGPFEAPVDPEGNTPDEIAAVVEARRSEEEKALHEREHVQEGDPDEIERLKREALEKKVRKIQEQAGDGNTFNTEQ